MGAGCANLLFPDDSVTQCLPWLMLYLISPSIFHPHSEEEKKAYDKVVSERIMVLLQKECCI